MKTLLLAAGNSTRIREASGGRPKPLMEIAGATILSHNLRWLAESGMRDVFINVHFQAELIREHVGDGSAWNLHVEYLEEPELLGTAGAWKNLHPGETSLVVYGDNLTRFDLRHFQAAHKQSGCLCSIALFDQDAQANTGIAGGRVEMGEGGRVRRFTEGGQVGLVNAGVYLLEPELLETIPAGRAYDFARELFPLLLERETPLHGYHLDGFCLGLDNPQSLARARELVDSRKVQLL